MSEALAPICFGAITFYSGDSDRCIACNHFGACGPKVEANIKEASRVMDLDGVLARHREFMAKRKQAQLAADDGKLNTQAPPVEQNVEKATVALKPGPAVELKALAGSILLPLLGGGTVAELHAELKEGRNPFPQSMREQWVLCELLLRGAATRASIEGAVMAISGDENRKLAVLATLTAAKLVKVSGDAVELA